MGVKLNQLIDRCLEIAGGRGLNASTPIVVKIKEPTLFRETLIAVSYEEPHELILPLNVTWIDANPNSIDYFKAFKRVSKTPDGGFYNTWEEILSYDEVFEPPQYWAPEDTPIPVYSEEQQSGVSDEQLAEKVSRDGDTMTGPLRARTLPSGESWGTNEFFPRGFFTTELNRNTQGFYSILSLINTRLTSVEQLALDNKRRLDELGDIGGGGSGTDQAVLDRLTALEEALTQANALNEQQQQRLATLENTTDVGDSGTDDQRITALEEAVAALGPIDVGDSGTDDQRITALETAVQNLQNNGSGVNTFTFTQSVASTSWTVTHNLASTNLIYEVRNSLGVKVIPERQYVQEGSGNNISIITFAEPIEGTVFIVAV